MTARLITNYRSPTPLHAPLKLEGHVDRVEGRKIFAVGTMHAGDTLTADGEALFIAMDQDRFRAMLDSRNATSR